MKSKKALSSPLNFLSEKNETTFLVSLIVSCLNSLDQTPNIIDQKNQAVNFLLNEKSDHWSFNYWQRKSKKNKDFPYPDDLDDTFCALSAIFGHNPKILNGKSLAKIITILTATEKKEGGPYQTWIVPENAPDVWKDIDLAVNANIAYFLALQDIFLPNLRKFFIKKINDKNISSKYYPTIFPVAYFLSRYISLDKKISDKTKKQFQKIILSGQKANSNWENPLLTALAVSALIRLGFVPKSIDTNIQYLKKFIGEKTKKIYPFCYDPVINGKQYFAGSISLTLAFCFEAISLFEKSKIKKQEKNLDKTGEKIYKTVLKIAQKRFESLDTDLKSISLSFLKKTIEKDKDKQVILMPYFFVLGLDKKNIKKIPNNFLVSLGLANLYGWIAYTIYDDFLDDEGKPIQLSLANLCLRELSSIFTNILPNTEFPQIFTETMDILDSANAWEIANCRFNPSDFPPQKIPDYGNYLRLSDRSFGHALGPIAVLVRLGFSKKSVEIKKFISFFQNYIIARQLNDDAHDWEDDLKKGHINSVAAEMLSRHPTKNPSELENIFWFKTFENIATKILKHTSKAKIALKENTVIKNTFLLEYLVSLVEKSTQLGLEEKKESTNFLETYAK